MGRHLNHMKRLLWGAVALLGLAAGHAQGAACQSAQAGNWSAPATWTSCNNGIPQNGDSATINHAVTVDGNVGSDGNNALSGLTVGNNGVLQGGSYTLVLKGNLTVNGRINWPTGTVSLYSATSQWGGGATGSAIILSSIVMRWSAGLTFAPSAAYTIELRGATPLDTQNGNFNNNGANANNKVTLYFNGAGNQSFTNTKLQYPNLRLGGGGTKTDGASSVTVLGNLTVDAGTTFDASSATSQNAIGGDLTVGGTFKVSPGNNGAWEFNGTTTQTITGAVYLYGIIVSNSSGVVLNGGDLSLGTTSSGRLQFTAGGITTGTNKVIINTPCDWTNIVTGEGTNNKWINGKVQLTFSGYKSTCTFPVGDSLYYAPIDLFIPYFSDVGNIGGKTLTGSTTRTEHPQIGTSGLNPNKDANRYWTLGGTGDTFGCVPLGSDKWNPGYYLATFYFNDPDLDAGAATKNFQVGRYAGGWAPPGVDTAKPHSTSIKVDPTGPGATDGSPFGTYAVGEVLGAPSGGGATNSCANPWGGSQPGAFNAYETATAPATSATGVIKTKVAGQPYSLDVVALKTDKSAVDTTFNGAVAIDVLGLAAYNPASPPALDASGCPAGATVLASPSGTPTISNGRTTVSFPAEANAWGYAKVRIKYTANGSTLTSCSGDAFAIRPNVLGLLAQTSYKQSGGAWVTLAATTTAGTPVHPAGQPFQLTVTGYNGAAAPAITSNWSASSLVTAAAVGGGMTAGTFATGTLAGSGGTVVSASATYSEVGPFTGQLFDTAFARVDSGDGTSADCSGWWVCSPAVAIGRFIPDHFDLSNGTLTNRGDVATCADNFTYTGEPFRLAFTLTARNAAGATTKNYDATSGWARLDGSQGAKWVQGTSAVGAGNINPWGINLTNNAPLAAGRLAVWSGSSVGVCSAPAGAWFQGAASFAACLNVTRNATAENSYEQFRLGVAPVDEDGATLATTAFTLDADNSGSNERLALGTTRLLHGRLSLDNAYGSEILPLPMPMQTQYWITTSGSGYWAANAQDSCTAVTSSSISLTNYGRNLSAGETTPCLRRPGETLCASSQSAMGGKFSLIMGAPGTGNDGWVTVGYATATALPWLDPARTGKATFGPARRPKVQYQRENFGFNF